ncbi:MAG: ribosome biogenesis GTPase Der [Alphaproteobacteria bacterium]|nr:ribosome biogenesis GTPase Der [Alphaproteobacteria bacterium]
MSLTVAIIGRPNVGKSTLFNRLTGRRQAMVDDTPGVTRDRREGEARLEDLSFTVIDTAGLDEEGPKKSLQARMREQTDQALAAADVALLLIDGRAGVTPIDSHFARWLRRTDTPLVLVANKCEARAADPGLAEAYGLGLGAPVAMSAEHGLGLAELHERLAPFAEMAAEGMDSEDMDSGDTELQEGAYEEKGGPLRMAIIGRPNVGKSTLGNHILGEERLLTGPEPGVTRDAVAVAWSHEGRDVEMFDTAGLRRRARVSGRIEKMSVDETLRAVRFAHVVVLVLDAEVILEKQDLSIAHMVETQGRALVIAINKWDLVKNRAELRHSLRERLDHDLPQLRGVPFVTLSALTGKGTGGLMPAVLKAYDVWNTRVPTARLNRWLEKMAEQHSPPAASGRRLKLRYMTQIKARPPTFALFVNRPGKLPESYIRYLVNGLRTDFALDGAPLRFNLRKGRNPYDGG